MGTVYMTIEWYCNQSNEKHPHSRVFTLYFVFQILNQYSQSVTINLWNSNLSPVVLSNYLHSGGCIDRCRENAPHHSDIFVPSFVRIKIMRQVHVGNWFIIVLLTGWGYQWRKIYIDFVWIRIPRRQNLLAGTFCACVCILLHVNWYFRCRCRPK